MLAGWEIVRDCMEDDVISGFVKKFIYEEIIPILPLPEDELLEFAGAVSDRFKNPYIDHRLSDISLNSIAKWKARVMPSLLEYTQKFGKLPALLSFSLAALIRFYKCSEKDGNFIGIGRGKAYPVRDDVDVCRYFANMIWDANAVKTILANTDFWGRDLNQLDGLTEKVEQYIQQIDELGAHEVMRSII